MLNRLIHWSIANRFLVVALSVALLIAAGFLWKDMDVDVLPEFAPPQVVIQTEAPGYVAEEVESLISLPLETAMNGTPGVVSVKSLSMTGISKITIVFQEGTNVYTDRQLVQEKIQLVQSRLPQGVGSPVMEPVMSELGDVMKIGLVSDSVSPMDLRTFADWDLKNRLLAVPGVARVVNYGGDQRQFQVIVDPDDMRSANVTLDQVISAVRRCNSVAADGFVFTNDQQIPIRGVMRAKGIRDIADAVIVSRGGVPITVRHVAKVVVGPAFKMGDALVNGKPGVELVVTKQPWVGTLSVTSRLEAALKDMQAAHKNIQFVNIFRQADFIDVSVKNMMDAILLGGFIVVLILLMFLFNWRTSVVSLVAIPASLIAAIAVLKLCGGSVNTMTLGGLAIAVGEVVDDAVVDVENVFRRLRENASDVNPKSALKIIFDACREVRSSVVYATFVVALVFLPVLSLTGVEGRLFGQLGIAYVSATMCSLGVALTLTPALCAYFLARYGAVPKGEPPVVAWIKQRYGAMLSSSIARPSLTVSAALVCLVLSVSLIPFMGHAFLPEFQEKDLMIPTSGLAGQNLEATVRMGHAVQDALAKSGLVAAVGERIGRAELDEDAAPPSFGEFDVKLKPGVDLDKASDQLRKTLEQIPGITFEVASFLYDHINDVLSGGTQADLVVKIYGPDLQTLRTISKNVADILKEQPGFADVTPEQELLTPEVDVKLDRARAARYGLTAESVSTTLNAILAGPVVSQVLDDGKLFGLRVWGAPYTRRSLEEIQAIPIDTADGAKVPLSDIATVSLSEGPNAIIRENVNRRIIVMANITNKNMVGAVDAARKKIDQALHIPDGYYVVYAGQYAAQHDSSQRLGLLSAVALLGIAILLRQGLGGWRPTLLVISNLPLAAIGGLVAVAVTGNVLSLGSLIGFISLFGISTRNSLLLVSHINQLIHERVPLQRAVYRGCIDRVVPVLMTALTAALGMLPLAVLGGSGRELEQPLAIVIVGGLISSTALTLIVIPSLCMLFGRSSLVAVHSGSVLDETLEPATSHSDF